MKQKMKDVEFLFLLCLVMVACSNGKSKQGTKEVEDVSSIFCKEDTNTVVRLTTEYLDHLKKKEFEQALQMLHYAKSDSLSGISETERDDLTEQYSTFPVLSYEIKGVVFNPDLLNAEVMYTIEFFKLEPGQEGIPNTMNFRLNVQKMDDVWYLGVLNK